VVRKKLQKKENDRLVDDWQHQNPIGNERITKKPHNYRQ
jgi:hypothetical protein